MTLPPEATPTQLLAERDRLESLLEASEDWRALRRIEDADVGVEPLSALSIDALRARLRLALADNPFYRQREKVVAALNALTAAGPATELPQSTHEKVAATGQDIPLGDDLTKIRGIDRTLAAKLRDLGVTRFDQIRDWTAADVSIVRFALKIGGRISAENWIEKAAVLAARRDAATGRSSAASAPPSPTPPPVNDVASPDHRSANATAAEPSPQDVAPSPEQPTLSTAVGEPARVAPQYPPPLPLPPSSYGAASDDALAANDVVGAPMPDEEDEMLRDHSASGSPVPELPLVTSQSEPPLPVAEAVRAADMPAAPRPMPPSAYPAVPLDTITASHWPRPEMDSSPPAAADDPIGLSEAPDDVDADGPQSNDAVAVSVPSGGSASDARVETKPMENGALSEFTPKPTREAPDAPASAMAHGRPARRAPSPLRVRTEAFGETNDMAAVEIVRRSRAPADDAATGLPSDTAQSEPRQPGLAGFFRRWRGAR